VLLHFTIQYIIKSIYYRPRDTWVTVTTTWSIFRLRVEEGPPDVEERCEYVH